MESELDKAIREACERLPERLATALRLAVRAEQDGAMANMENGWAHQRRLADERDALATALRDLYDDVDGLFPLEGNPPRRGWHPDSLDRAAAALAKATGADAHAGTDAPGPNGECGTCRGFGWVPNRIETNTIGQPIYRNCPACAGTGRSAGTDEGGTGGRKKS